MITTSEALTALDEIFLDEDGHRHFDNEDYKLREVVQTYIIAHWPRELKDCGARLGMQWCYELGNRLIAIPMAQPMYPDAVHIFHQPSGFRVSAARNLHEAWYFAHEVGSHWDGITVALPNLEFEAALDATWQWEHANGLHDDGCECPYGEDEAQEVE